MHSPDTRQVSCNDGYVQVYHLEIVVCVPRRRTQSLKNRSWLLHSQKERHQSLRMKFEKHASREDYLWSHFLPSSQTSCALHESSQSVLLELPKLSCFLLREDHKSTLLVLGKRSGNHRLEALSYSLPTPFLPVSYVRVLSVKSTSHFHS